MTSKPEVKVILERAESRFMCECQIAGQNFSAPSFINGHWVVFSEDLFAVMFLELRSISFYHRVQENLGRVALRSGE